MKHWRGWEGAAAELDAAQAGCGIWRGQMQLPACRCHIWVFLFLFLFFFDSRWLGFDSAKIGLYWPAAKIVETDQNGRNRPKSALNHAGTAEISSEWGPNILNLSFLNFILNICCFFCVCVCVFFFLCFLPSSFFVLWIKDIVMCFLRIF